jgi:hypothetical protein
MGFASASCAIDDGDSDETRAEVVALDASEVGDITTPT